MNIEILSPSDGYVKECYMKVNQEIFPNQYLAIVINKSQKTESIISEFEGEVKNIFVTQGQEVVKGMILAVATIK